jgi:hypothetical protein
MNEILHRCFRKYVDENKPLETDFIFKSRKGKGPFSQDIFVLAKGLLPRR